MATGTSQKTTAKEPPTMTLSTVIGNLKYLKESLTITRAIWGGEGSHILNAHLEAITESITLLEQLREEMHNDAKV
jgi:hypothetical protein